MSWLTRFRLQAVAFFTACTTVCVWIAVHSFQQHQDALGVICVVGAGLGVYLLARGALLWRKGRLPVFGSKEEAERYAEQRTPWLPRLRRTDIPPPGDERD
jgi:hypothetical protein